MDNFKNRIGYDNFVWWIGVVEDREDPLKLGRCRVRIFGSHTENLQLIPTDTLPWAIPLYPVNNSRNWASPNEGEYVFGFFQDGLSCQAPVMMGVFPGVTQGEPKAGTGFSSLAKKANIVATTSSNAVTTTTTATTPAASSATNTTSNTSTITPTEPSVPKNAPAMVRFRVGEPTTPTNAYSANGTMLQITNSQVSHACDFRFLINFPNLDIGVIQNPITLIEQSIKNSKNKAAAIIRTMLAQIIDNFRLILKGVTIALNFDPTGQIAKAISLAREAIRTINYYSKKLAEIVGNAALMIALLSQLKQIIEWIKSLPATILAMLQNCLTNFQNSITSATNKISLIPGLISTSVENAFSELKVSTDSAISKTQIAEQTANVPNSLISIVNSPDTANLNVITQYITTQFPSANAVISDANGAAYNVANSSTP